MAKKLFTLFTLALLTIPLGWAATWPFQFSIDDEVTTSGSTGSYNGFRWTSSSATYIGWDASKGVQIGSNKKPQNSEPWTLTISDFTTYTIKKVIVYASVASSGGATIDVTVGGNAFGSQAVLTSNNTSDAAYTFEATGSGNVVISMISTKSKAMYIRCVTIEYESGSVTPTTVATPTFSPDGGTYTSAQNVSIGCTTSGATIHYTTDGSDPTSSSAVYSTPIAISTTTTLKAIAIKDGVTSTIATATYTITSSSGGDGEMTFERITRTEDLEVGEKYIIVYETSGYALEGDGGYAATSITIDNHTTTVASDANVGIFTLGTGYTLMYPDGKFLANSDASKGLKKQDEPQYWTITFDDDNANAMITGSSSRYIRYYSADFRTYKQDDGWPIQLYKHVNMGAYSINIASDIEHGTVTSSRKKADQGNPVTITATPDEGCVLESLTVDGTDVTGNVSDNSYTFTMPASDVTVTATFAVLQYGITVVKSNCEVTVAETAAYNSQVTFTVTPRSDKYEVSSVSVTYAENRTKPVTYDSNNGTYSFFMPASDVTLTVLCTRKAVGNVYTLVEKTEDLVSDQKYIILAKEYTAAMSTNLGSKSTNYTLSEEDKKATVTGDDVLVLTLSKINVGDETEWTLVNNGRYLNLPSGGDLKWSGDLQSFPITISGGIATINGYTTTDSRQLLYRNTSNGVFKNYSSSNANASGYSVVQLYKQTTASTQVTISPEGGSVIGSQEVEVDATTETAVVRYKVDNGDWSEWTTGPVNFTLTGNVGDIKVVTAQAMEPNQELEEGEEAEMDEASATYTFVAPNAPTITPASCSVVDVKQSVSITSSYTTTYPGTVIEYSTDEGTTWTTYSGEFDVLFESFGSKATVQARVTVNGVTSDVVSATYTRDIQPVQFSPVSGTYYYGEQSVEMFSVTRGARIYYTMTVDGSEPVDPVMNAQGTRLYSAPITDLQPGKTYRFKAVAYIGTTSSEVTSAEYTIQNKYTSGNYLYSVAELNAMDATSDHWTMVNPVQVIYMSTFQQNGYQPEYCLVRDNTGYGMIYFGKENTSHNNYHVFGMGDWIAGGYDGPISNFKYTPEGESQQVVADTHPELGTSTHGKQINNWPSSAMSNSPVLPEYLDIPTILSSDPTDADKDYWGHYVHLRKTSVALTEKDKDAKWTGIITDENGEQINYYDKFYLQSAEDWTVENNLFTGHDNRTFDVYGFVAYYKGDYQISPFAFAWIDQPTCSHATAEYTSVQQVTLTSDEDPEATIWYKTSEMDDYAIYHRGSTITVNSTTTIEWYATKMSAFNDELESKRGSVTLTFVEIAKPEISPKSVVKTVGKSVDVTIAFEQGKNVPDDAVIIYTTDGTDPKAGNQVYTLGTTMTFNTTTTVRAITRTGSEGNYVYSAEAEPQTYSFVKSNGVVYELVTNVNQLTESGVYMIVSKNYGEALSTTQNAANRGAAGVMFVEGSNKTKVYGNSDVALFQLSHLTHSDDQSGDNHFLFHTGNGANDAANGYLYVGHETDNTLRTEPEEDDLGNDVVLVTIDSDGRAHLQMNYLGGSNRYIQYWNRDRYFTTYKTEEDTERAVYIYYTASTPLAVIEQSGTKGKSYTVADDLQVVYVTSTNDYSVAWARDLVDNNQAVDVPTEADDVYDYMTNAGQQTGQWQQNNWVMLDFGNHARFSDLVSEFTAGKQPIIKGGSLVGEYTDDVNYTIRVSGDAQLVLDTQADPYVPNVYCAANYYGEPTQKGTNGRTYWFMTPKVMEVATHTWSVYQSGDNAGFYMPKSERIDGQWFNEAGLLGAYGLNMQYNEGTFTPDAGQAYRYLGVTLVKGTEGTTATAAPRHAPTSLEGLEAQPGSAISANREVAPLNLTVSEEQVVTAVSHITAGREVLSVTYSDVAGRQSSKPFDGVNIIVTRYTDGTTTTRKALF